MFNGLSFFDIYNKSPVLVQDILISIKGLHLKRLRYSKVTWQTYEFLQKSQYWSIDQFNFYQSYNLRKLVKHAMGFSPFYAKYYKDLGIDERQLQSIADIKLLPILSKEDFRVNNSLFVSTHEKKTKMWVSNTSGTTGTPLKAFHTHEDMQKTIAFLERLYNWYSPTKYRRRASFTGKLIVPPGQTHGPFSRKNYAINQWLFSSHHLHEENLEEYIKELFKLNPVQIDGIASSIFVIADYIIRTGQIGVIKPSVVIPTSETLWPHIRQRIETAFNCKISNQYGSQEGAPIAYECPNGGFHISPECGIFEILKPDDSSCKPGELGRLVVTNFLSTGTPIIRYDIGDIASWRDGKCICKRNMPLLETIEGRMDDMFYTNERGVIGRVDSAFKSIPESIKATQVAQISPEHFEVRIIPDQNKYKKETGEILKENLYDYLGNSVKIKIKLVSQIDRTTGGKMRAMVNESQEVKEKILKLWNLSNKNKKE